MITVQELNNFFDKINDDKNKILNDLKGNNVDDKTIRDLGKKLNVINILQSNLLKLRQLYIIKEF
jgi:benzoyl-CoA reductase/2-hydroxyglutaryl-CoA dehydratase subunit BcrC/BadD/HgdB